MMLPYGSMMARFEVMDFVVNYITRNKLDTKIIKNRIIIIPDEALQRILTPSKGEYDKSWPLNPQMYITYYNLQKYLNRHYIKEEEESAKKRKNHRKDEAVQGRPDEGLLAS